MSAIPYVKKNFTINEWNHYKEKNFFNPLATLISKDKSYKVTKYQRDHKNDCLWRTAKALEALFLTVITLGLALLIKQVFNLYLQAYYAKEIVAVKEYLTPKKNLLDLPKDIQNHIISFIPALEARKMLQVSKTNQQSSAEYFQSFDGMLATFYELRDNFKDYDRPNLETLNKFREYACHILKYPKIIEHLKYDQQRKNKLLEYFINDHIDWGHLDEESGINLCTIIFETASNEQLKQFILKRVCKTIQVKYEIMLHTETLCKCCAKVLDDQRIKRLLDLNDEEILVALVHLLSYWRPSQQRYLLIKDLYQKMPTNQIWAKTEKLKNIPFAPDFNCLESEMVAIKIMKVLDQPIKNEEKQKSIRELLGKLTLPWLNGQALMSIIIQNYKLNNEHVEILVNNDIKNYFLENALQMQDFKLLEPLFKGYFERSIRESRARLSRIMAFLKTKEHAEALISTCNSLDEPFRTISLRVLVDFKKTFNYEKAPQKLIHDAFTTYGLNFQDFIRLEYKVMEKWLYSLRTFNLQAFDIERLKNFFNEINDMNIDRKISLEKQLRALAAGIQITDDLSVKTQISEDDTKKIFEKHGYIFSHFNEPIILEELVCDMHYKWKPF